MISVCEGKAIAMARVYWKEVAINCGGMVVNVAAEVESGGYMDGSWVETATAAVITVMAVELVVVHAIWW